MCNRGTRKSQSKAFTLVLPAEYELAAEVARQRVIVRDCEEGAYALALLGEDAEVFVGDKARASNTEFVKWACSLEHPEYACNLNWPDTYNEKVASVIGNIPIYNEATARTELAFFSNSPVKLGPCAKELTHKTKPENVMISEPMVYRAFCHYNLLPRKETLEFQYDHDVDHIRALNAIEAIRQAGVATLHVFGTPVQSNLVLTKMTIEFCRFLELDAPVVIRITHRKPEKSGAMYSVWVAFQVSQYLQECANGYISGSVFLNDKLWKSFRARARRGNVKNEKKGPPSTTSGQ